MDIRIGDALRLLPKLVDHSIDCTIIDPPYGVTGAISWDDPQITIDPVLWSNLFRVLKPGAFLICFAAPSRYHEVATAAALAGFVIRTPLSWQYAPIFPKTRKASRIIDTAANAKGKQLGTINRLNFPDVMREARKTPRSPTLRVLGPVTSDAKRFAGQYFGDGTIQLAGEPILQVQRPPEPGRKMDSLRRHGTGAIQVEDYRQRYRAWPSTVLNVPKSSRIEQAGCDHPTQKPIELIRRLVMLFAPRGGVVLDCFAGSGSTGAAAILEQRKPILIERDPTMRKWIRAKLERAEATTGPLISVNRNKTIRASLSQARRVIERLDRVERRLNKIAQPYAARVAQAGVELHLAGLAQSGEFRALLEQHQIVLRKAKSPAQGAARLMFESAPASTINMYANCMGWALERLHECHCEPSGLADLILREGGVQAVADQFSRSKGIRPRIVSITNREYGRAVRSLPVAGMLLSEAGVEIGEALALIRTDSKGRRAVSLIKSDLHRVRSAVMRYTEKTRRAPIPISASRTK